MSVSEANDKIFHARFLKIIPDSVELVLNGSTRYIVTPATYVPKLGIPYEDVTKFPQEESDEDNDSSDSESDSSSDSSSSSSTSSSSSAKVEGKWGNYAFSRMALAVELAWHLKRDNDLKSAVTLAISLADSTSEHGEQLQNDLRTGKIKLPSRI